MQANVQNCIVLNVTFFVMHFDGLGEIHNVESYFKQMLTLPIFTWTKTIQPLQFKRFKHNLLHIKFLFWNSVLH